MNANTSISKTTRPTLARRIELDPVEDTVFSPELKALLEQGGENSKTANPTAAFSEAASDKVKFNLD